MVIVIPLEATNQLMQAAQTHQLDLPVPLSSGCASYLSPEEMETIVQLLTPLSAGDATIERLLADLQTYTKQPQPVTPCDN